MTQHKSSGFDRSGLPGLSMMNDLFAAYGSMWDRHVHAVNEAWTDCTCDQATASDWPKAWNKVLQAWTDSAHDFYTSFIGHGVSHAGGAPLVTFVIDQSAETAGPQSVPLPPNVDPQKLVATRLVSLTYDGHDELDPQIAAVRLIHFKGRIEIRVALHVPRVPIKHGHYLSVVCEPKAGAPAGDQLTDSPDPPPRPVVATLLVLFI